MDREDVKLGNNGWNPYRDLPTIVAVDYDGVLMLKDGINMSLVRGLIELQKWGVRVILWTCRGGYDLSEALAKCNQAGLMFYAVNRNVSEQIMAYNNDSRKIFAHFYIDDQALGFNLNDIPDYLEKIRKTQEEYLIRRGVTHA